MNRRRPKWRTQEAKVTALRAALRSLSTTFGATLTVKEEDYLILLVEGRTKNPRKITATVSVIITDDGEQTTK